MSGRGAGEPERGGAELCVPCVLVGACAAWPALAAAHGHRAMPIELGLHLAGGCVGGEGEGVCVCGPR